VKGYRSSKRRAQCLRWVILQAHHRTSPAVRKTTASGTQASDCTRGACSSMIWGSQPKAPVVHGRYGRQRRIDRPWLADCGPARAGPGVLNQSVGTMDVYGIDCTSCVDCETVNVFPRHASGFLLLLRFSWGCGTAVWACHQPLFTGHVIELTAQFQRTHERKRRTRRGGFLAPVRPAACWRHNSLRPSEMEPRRAWLIKVNTDAEPSRANNSTSEHSHVGGV